jgi:hypothetical protein
MSDEPWDKPVRNLTDAAVGMVWRQWRAVGGGASGNRPIAAQVDPEALILASLALLDQEPRLRIVMPDWLIDGARFIGTQRLKNLAPRFGASVLPRLSALAGFVVHRAKDARWRTLLGGGGAGQLFGVQEKRRSSGVVLVAGPTLVLRLRAAFGVGVKADVVAYLLGQELRSTVSSVSESLGCSAPTAFRALQDLVSAGLVRTEEVTAATEYVINGSSWTALLGRGMAEPLWRWWAELLAYVVDVLSTTQSLTGRDVSPFALGVKLRDAGERHARGLTRARGLNRFPTVPDSTEPDAWFAHYKAVSDYLAHHA